MRHSALRSSLIIKAQMHVYWPPQLLATPLCSLDATLPSSAETAFWSRESAWIARSGSAWKLPPLALVHCLPARSCGMSSCGPGDSHERTRIPGARHRISEEGDSIRRRRRCEHCDKRFTTYERIELAMPTIVKKNGSRAEYERSKLQASILLALRKRRVSAEAIEAALARIEEKRSFGAREVASDRSASWWCGNCASSAQDRLCPLRLGLPQFRGCGRVCRGVARNPSAQDRAAQRALVWPPVQRLSR